MGFSHSLGQTEKNSVRVNVFRSSPKADVPAETHRDVHSKSNIMRLLFVDRAVGSLP
jgi:hypothetical protein